MFVVFLVLCFTVGINRSNYFERGRILDFPLSYYFQRGRIWGLSFLHSLFIIIIRSYYFQTGRVWCFPFLFLLLQCVIVTQYLTFFRELGFLGLGFSRSFPLFSGAEESSMLCPEPGFYNPEIMYLHRYPNKTKQKINIKCVSTYVDLLKFTLT